MIKNKSNYFIKVQFFNGSLANAMFYLYSSKLSTEHTKENAHRQHKVIYITAASMKRQKKKNIEKNENGREKGRNK